MGFISFCPELLSPLSIYLWIEGSGTYFRWRERFSHQERSETSHILPWPCTCVFWEGWQTQLLLYKAGGFLEMGRGENGAQQEEHLLLCCPFHAACEPFFLPRIQGKPLPLFLKASGMQHVSLLGGQNDCASISTFPSPSTTLSLATSKAAAHS